MTDEFVQFTHEGIHASTEGNMLRMWGEFGDYRENQVYPTGISFHWPDSWDEFSPGESEQPRVAKLESLAKISEEAGVPLIWFGEHDVSWRSAEGSVEIGKLKSSADDVFDTDLEIVSIANLETVIQDLLGTNLSVKGGADKEVNMTTNSFQDYTQEYLPRGYIIQDFDVLVEQEPGVPAGLVEIKRTRRSPSSWTPYSNDWPNYYLQISLADSAGIDPLLLHHDKQLVNDRSVGFYYEMERPDNPNTDSDNDFLTWKREIISSSEARDRLRKCNFRFD